MRTDDDHAPCASIWTGIRTDRARAFDAAIVEISGWMIPLDQTAAEVDYFLLASDEPCCGGCVPRDPFSCIEVVSRDPIALRVGAVRLRGRLLRLTDDPAGWRYRLESAVHVCDAAGAPSPVSGMSRRSFVCLSVHSMG